MSRTRGRIARLCAGTACALVTIVLAGGAAPSAVAAPPIGWNALRSGTAADLNAVSFPDSRHGHAVGVGGTILATTDGGRTWARQYACASSTPCLPSSRDHITATLLAVDFVDAFHGWTMGAGGTILATSDGGTTWTPQLACQETSIEVVRHYCNQLSADRVTVDLRGVSFVDALHGWSVGDNETILATTDGGHAWVQQVACVWGPADSGVDRPCPARPDDHPPRDLRSVSFIDAAHGMAVGKLGYAVATADGGQTWTRIMSSGALELRAVSFVVRGYPDFDEHLPTQAASDRMDTAHAAGVGGSLLVSGPKGADWYGTGGQDAFTSQPPASQEDLNAVDFCDSVNGIVVGDGGVIERTTDGGVAWHTEPSGSDASLRGVALPDANDAVVVGDGGVILELHTAPVGLAVTGVSSKEIPTGGGLPITIAGKGFSGAEEVSFGKAWAAGFSVDSDHQITAMPPPLPVGAVHVTVTVNGMTSVRNDADLVTYTVPGGGTWTAVGSCPDRCDGPMVRLRDGRVLVEGGHPNPPYGHADDVALTGAEVFDPSSDRWTATTPMHVPRVAQTATLLADGRVLVAGGDSNPGSWPPATTSAEIYDPSTGRWTLTGSMHEMRHNFSAVLLPNGKVLVAGGDLKNGDSAELYDPSDGHWTVTGSMHAGRSDDTLLLLRTGKVLVVGSMGNDTSTELYDPATGRWTETGALEVPRSQVTVTLLANGSVLVTGGRYVPAYSGRAANPYPYAELYNPTTGSWRPTGPMVFSRVGHAAVVLHDGRVLVMGGENLTFRYCPPCDPMTSAEIYDPARGSWSVVAPMTEARQYPVAALLTDGGVLVTGYDGITEVFHAAPTPAEAAQTGTGWVVLVGVAMLVIIAAMSGVTVARARRRRRPPRGRPPRTPTPPRERPAVAAR